MIIFKLPPFSNRSIPNVNHPGSHEMSVDGDVVEIWRDDTLIARVTSRENQLWVELAKGRP